MGEAGETQAEQSPAASGWSVWRAIRVLSLCAALMAVAGALAGYLVLEYVRGPGVARGPVAIAIPEGASGRQVGDLLADAGLVEHELLFRMAMRLDKSGDTIKHGEHRVPQGSSPAEVLRALQQTPEVELGKVKVTIPEGLTIAQTAPLIEDSAGVLAAALKVSAKEALGIDAPSLQGFLMPNTYYFETAPTGEQLVTRMLEQFRAEWEKLAAEFPEAAKDPVRIVTVASLIEEEARVAEERPLVAAVIYNRLEKGRTLDMDSTLQFALNKYGQRLLDEDKAVDSPYNTYRVAGLPPGPISNPGLASLRAALAPAKVKYLYFVSNADGKTHTFSNTLKEHEAAVAKYRKEIRTQRREVKQQDED